MNDLDSITITEKSSKQSSGFLSWELAELPNAPVFRMRQWTILVGPGLMMAGANIGGGEWLLGPLVTAQYGGRVMWLATVAILMQVFFNLAVMRYTLYTGESIFVGFFRTPQDLGFGRSFISWQILAAIGLIWLPMRPFPSQL